MSLKEQLDAHSRASARSLPPELLRANDLLVEQLQTSGMLGAILTAGDPMPDFELADGECRLWSSRDLRARGPLVVSFFRGDWCPYCRLELQALEAARADIERQGAQLVAITPDTGSALAAAKNNNNLTFTVLSDPDHGVAVQFGVAYRIPDPLREQYLKRGLDLGARHGNEGCFLPVPATFVIDRNGIILHAGLDPDPRHRMEPADIVEVLRRFSS